MCLFCQHDRLWNRKATLRRHFHIPNLSTEKKNANTNATAPKNLTSVSHLDILRDFSDRCIEKARSLDTHLRHWATSGKSEYTRESHPRIPHHYKRSDHCLLAEPSPLTAQNTDPFHLKSIFPDMHASLKCGKACATIPQFANARSPVNAEARLHIVSNRSCNTCMYVWTSFILFYIRHLPV